MVTIQPSQSESRFVRVRIVADLGPEVPRHVSGYYPAYRFTVPPTPVRTLERAWRIGRESGLRFVYLGNVLGHRLENSYCIAAKSSLLCPAPHRASVWLGH